MGPKIIVQIFGGGNIMPNNQEYELVKRELIHKGKIVEFYRDHMRLPSNKVVEWDYIHHPGAAAIVPVDQDGKIIMVKQYRSPAKRYTLEIPAGGLEPEEDTRTCAIRELEEETGYQANHVEHLIDLYAACAYSDEKIDIYYASDLYFSEQHADEDEFIHVERYFLEELVQFILDGTIMDGKTIAGVLAYKTKLGL